MMVTMLFYLDLTGKQFWQKILISKNSNQKLRHQEVEAEALRVEAEAIQNLPLPYFCVRVVFSFISKQILRARVFSEQIVALKICFVSYTV